MTFVVPQPRCPSRGGLYPIVSHIFGDTSSELHGLDNFLFPRAQSTQVVLNKKLQSLAVAGTCHKFPLFGLRVPSLVRYLTEVGRYLANALRKDNLGMF